MKVKDYLLNVGSTLSQAVNCCLLLGNPDESISARSYYNRHVKYQRWAYVLINKLFFFQEDHCRDAAYRDYKNSVRTIKRWGDNE